MPGTSNSGGRNAKGTQLHVLQGTFRRGRHAQHHSPDPPQGRPQPPKPLTREGRAEWTRLVTRLEKTGALSVVDDAALYQCAALFAETEAIGSDYAETRKLSVDLAKQARRLDGAELTTAITEITKLRQLLARQTTQLRQGRMALRQYLVEFGLTPAARGRVKLPAKSKTQADTDRERFFGRGTA